MSAIKAHLHKFMHAGFNAQGHTDLRTRVQMTNGKPTSFDQLVDIAKEHGKDWQPTSYSSGIIALE